MNSSSAIATIERTATTLNAGMPMFHGPMWGHFLPPMANRPSAIGRVNDRNRKITVHDTTMEYAGVPAIVMELVNQTNSVASTAAVQIDAIGVRRRGLTLASAFEAPGMPPSREKANS